MNLRLGFATHPGRVRPHNEDNYGILFEPKAAPEINALLVAADGMGGHQAGEVASGFVVQNLLQLFGSTANYRALADYNPERDDYFAAVLKDVLEVMNDQLQNKAASQDGLRGMGTTATVALLSNQKLFIGHVGDSRAYLLRNGTLQQLTHDDHSAAEANNVLTQAIGAGFTVRVDRSIHPVQAGDSVFMCTDGLTNVVGDAEILQAIAGRIEPQAACERLITLANQRGGPDNITTILACLECNGTGRQASPNSCFSSVALASDPISQQDTEPIARPRTGQRTPGAAMQAQPAMAPEAHALRPPSRHGAWMFGFTLVLLAVLSAGVTVVVVITLHFTDPYAQAMAGTVALVNFCIGAAIGVLGFSRRAGR